MLRDAALLAIIGSAAAFAPGSVSLPKTSGARGESHSLHTVRPALPSRRVAERKEGSVVFAGVNDPPMEEFGAGGKGFTPRRFRIGSAWIIGKAETGCMAGSGSSTQVERRGSRGRQRYRDR